MAYDYEKLYRDTPEALGGPNADVMAFFAGRNAPLNVLDIGCGQGRDALPIARMGHRVHGVDLAPSGIRDLIKQGEAEGLSVTGQVADLVNYLPGGGHDILLIDRTLHMLGEEDRHAVLARLMGAVRPRGWLLLIDEPSNMAGLRAISEKGGFREVEYDRPGVYFARHAE